MTSGEAWRGFFPFLHSHRQPIHVRSQIAGVEYSVRWTESNLTTNFFFDGEYLTPHTKPAEQLSLRRLE